MICNEFKDVVNEILSSQNFGECPPNIRDSLQGILQGKDPYLVGVDFNEYLKA